MYARSTFAFTACSVRFSSRSTCSAVSPYSSFSSLRFSRVCSVTAFAICGCHRARWGVGVDRRDVLDAPDGLAEFGDLGVDDGLDVDLDVAVAVGDRRRLRDLDGLAVRDLALLRGWQLLEDLLDVLGVAEDTRDIGEQAGSTGSRGVRPRGP